MPFNPNIGYHGDQSIMAGFAGFGRGLEQYAADKAESRALDQFIRGSMAGSPVADDPSAPKALTQPQGMTLEAWNAAEQERGEKIKKAATQADGLTKFLSSAHEVDPNVLKTMSLGEKRGLARSLEFNAARKEHAQAQAIQLLHYAGAQAQAKERLAWEREKFAQELPEIQERVAAQAEMRRNIGLSKIAQMADVETEGKFGVAFADNVRRGIAPLEAYADAAARSGARVKVGDLVDLMKSGTKSNDEAFFSNTGPQVHDLEGLPGHKRVVTGPKTSQLVGTGEIPSNLPEPPEGYVYATNGRGGVELKRTGKPIGEPPVLPQGFVPWWDGTRWHAVDSRTVVERTVGQTVGKTTGNPRPEKDAPKSLFDQFRDWKKSNE